MTVQQLREAHKAQPFEPFRLRLVDGRTYFVPHPDFFYVSPTGGLVIVCEEGDITNFLDFAQITAIEQAPSSIPAA